MHIVKALVPYYFIGTFFLFVLLFPFPESQTTFNWNSTCDALHLPLFFLANITIIKLIGEFYKKPINAPLVSSVSLLLIGITIEIIQPYFSRGFSYKDVTVNLLGILLSYLLICKHANKLKMLKFVSIFSFIFVTAPIVNSYLLYKQRISSFPILFNPDTKLIEIAHPTYKSKLKKELSNCGLKITPSKLPWSGVNIDFAYSNWSHFKYLRITLHNPNETPITLGLRIDDNGDNTEFGSRYNETFSISPNQTINLELPLSMIKRKVKNRAFNLESLDRALIFPLNSVSPFCVGKIDLK